ncbi:hypothetical protein LYZ86_24250, partial [Xanthomonas hortorum pv. cynarae]|uniref:hypothetical protein n=1 Tax=Xanthomonas hortorum TaxID=56454 RepID=UPI001F28F37D
PARSYLAEKLPGALTEMRTAHVARACTAVVDAVFSNVDAPAAHACDARNHLSCMAEMVRRFVSSTPASGSR